MTEPLRILVSAGEISGDAYAAALLRELRRILPRPVEAFGIGGDQLRAEGVELIAHASETGVMGFWEVAKRFRFFLRLMARTGALLEVRRPDLLLTVDYPGFNLRLAALAKKRGVKTVHFICPQVWAWHKSRIPKIAAALDKLICLFPFEPPLFAGTGLDAVFCGHPLPGLIAESLAAAPGADDVRKPPGGRLVALFPGSRATEISRILPVELEAAAILDGRLGGCDFVVPAPTPAARDAVLAALPALPRKPARLSVRVGGSRRMLARADAAAVKSGTSTLEACILLCPSVIVYKMSRFSAFVVKRLATRLRFVGLPNILAKRAVCRELLQDDFTAAALADELERMLCNERYRAEMLAGMRSVNARLRGDSAAQRAAAEIAAALGFGAGAPEPGGLT